MRDFGEQIWLDAFYPVCRVVTIVYALQVYRDLLSVWPYSMLFLCSSSRAIYVHYLYWTAGHKVQAQHKRINGLFRARNDTLKPHGCYFQTRPRCKTAQSYAEDIFYASYWHCDIWVSDRLSEFRLRAGVYYNLEICPPSPERWNFYLDMSRSDGTNNTTSIKSRAAQSRRNQPGSQHRRVTRCQLASATAIT